MGTEEGSVKEKDDWWKQDAFTLGYLESEESHVTLLKGRQVDGVWEYVAVRYRYMVPTLLWTLKEGKLEVDDDR